MGYSPTAEMALSMSLSATAIVAIIVECILYGMYLTFVLWTMTLNHMWPIGISLALCGATMWALVYRRTTAQINRPLCTATVLLLVLSTAVCPVPVMRSCY